MPVGELNFAVPTLFGLEGLCADEIRRLGLPSVQAENGRVLCTGTEAVSYTHLDVYKRQAQGLTRKKQHLDEDELLDVVTMPFQQLVEQVMDGTLSLIHISCLYRAGRHVRSEGGG